MQLTNDEKNCLLQLVDYSGYDDFTQQQYQCLIRDVLRPVLPHAGFIGGIGHKKLNKINITHFISVDYSTSFLEMLNTQTNTQERSIMAYWLEIQKPLCVTPSSHPDLTSPFELNEMQTFQLSPMLIHGQRDITGQMSSYFNLSQCSMEESRACWLMSLYTPYLHTLLLKVLLPNNKNAAQDVIQLTEREYQLLEFLKLGASNKRIAQTLNKSPSTIKHQMSALFSKLNVSTRTEAVAKFQTNI